MSRINAVRLINLNYNNNAIRISDETFHMNGESTLFSLRNGGGKSVLVQMMTAPFVHKRYRDAKDRPFESYFTTNKPTFILVEWALDQGAGYVLTGLMVRRSQELSGEDGEQKDGLEMVGMISEYRDRCIQDIHHLPVVEKTKKEMTLKNFGACRQLFESYKKDRSIDFFCYDMNNTAQSRQYFDKLSEYQIHYKEWETIIKKVNLKESGLSDLFSDCRDEKGLVEKWFLEAVESKLNKDRNRMKEFQSIVGKYVEQYMENRSKIQRRDTIRRFEEEGEKVRAEAVRYHQASGEVERRENMIAALISELNRLRDREEDQRAQVRRQIEGLQAQRDHLSYEKISAEIYALEKEERFHSSNRDMIDMEREGLEKECARIREQLHLLECARHQDSVDQDRRELTASREKLEISRRKGEDLEPERRMLGYALRMYYEEEDRLWQEKQRRHTEDTQQAESGLEKENKRWEELQDQIVDTARKMGEQKTGIRVFDQKEGRFNRQYGEKLARNILGEYEPGFIPILMEQYTRELEGLTRDRVTLRRQIEEWNEEKKRRTRNLEDMRGSRIQTQSNLDAARRIRAQFEGELGERRTVLRYLELEEQELFSTDKILSASEHKLREIGRVRREMEQEEDRLKKEYERLTQGKVLELPEEFESMLENLGVHYVYGMDWLKKNGRSAKENQKLTEEHPFLPYALILSARELKKLEDYMGRQEDQEVYTSFPIPMILREQLEQADIHGQRSIIDFDRVRFYVYFNRNLLDEEALKVMAQRKMEEMDRISASIARKQEEYKSYFEKQEMIRNQKVTEDAYRDNGDTIARMEGDIRRLEEELIRGAGELASLETQIDENQKQIQRLEKDILRQEARQEDFKDFSKDYDTYLEGIRELERLERQASRLQEQKQICGEKTERLKNQLKSLEYQGRDLEERLKYLKEKCAVYGEFENPEKEREEDFAGKPEEMEARYQAITSGLSAELKELEQRTAECRKRYHKSSEDLDYLAEKYGIHEETWKEITYNREEERHQESLLEDKAGRKAVKDAQWNEEDKKTAVLRQQIGERRRKMQEECGQEEPLSQSEIVTEDFDACMNQLAYEEGEKKKQEESHTQKINGYEGNLTSLAEYDHLKQKEEIIWEQDLSQMSRRQLDTFKGEMIRDYRRSMDESRECRARLVQLLNRILRMEEFGEDFYRKPLEALLELSGEARQVLAQLDTTVQSYNSLMEKLEVDISMVEKEKAKIVELLEDYLKDVHANLGKIDHNSTIMIRERPVKMLKIGLPDWQDNEALYQLRISDFMDEITMKGMERFERNENAQEYFGTQLTTRNLYDTVAGIGNVQIRLYKIEEQREYPITWADVAKNSGGEGFLSAFVILSSLLYYMRRDESDFFADRNEGKVLVMDNPFAQTNAAHLLKPLMDMAEKTNTQLICLSGLGGESIYNRFDNIYVLNLVSASLRNGVQYVRTDHMKGGEGETVMASRVQVTEQMELMF